MEKKFCYLMITRTYLISLLLLFYINGQNDSALIAVILRATRQKPQIFKFLILVR